MNILLCKNPVGKSLLNKLRDSLQPTMTKLGTSFASTGLSANFWTGVGLAFSIAAGVAYASPAFGISLSSYLGSDWRYTPLDLRIF